MLQKLQLRVFLFVLFCCFQAGISLAQSSCQCCSGCSVPIPQGDFELNPPGDLIIEYLMASDYNFQPSSGTFGGTNEVGVRGDAVDADGSFVGLPHPSEGGSKFLVAWTAINTTGRIWENTSPVTVDPNTDYCVRFLLRKLNDGGQDPEVDFRINGVSQGGNFTVTPLPNADDWHEFCFTWNSGTSNAMTLSLWGIGGPTVTAVGFDAIQVSKTFAITAQASPTTVCPGETSTLSVTTNGCESGALTYLWSENNQTTATIDVNPTMRSTYRVTVTDGNGCTASASVTVSVHSISVSLPSQVNACGGVATVTASGGTGTYTWSSGPSGPSNSIQVTTSGFYGVTFTDGNQCTATASTIVSLNGAPDVTISGDLSICSGESTTLTANCTGCFYQWADGHGNNASITVSPTQTTIYTVTATKGTCTATQSVTVTVTDSPTPQIVGPTVICEGQSATLDGTYTGPNSYSYSWSTGDLTPIITVFPTEATTYTVTVADELTGCLGTESITVDVFPNATHPDIGPICEQELYMFLDQGEPAGGTYSEAPGPFSILTISSIYLGNPGVHTLTYSVMDPQSGCGSSVDFTVEILDAPDPLLLLPTTLCSSTTPYPLPDGIPGGGTYAGSDVSNGELDISTPGTKHITYYLTDPVTGCEGYATATIEVEDCCCQICDDQVINGDFETDYPSSSGPGDFTTDYIYKDGTLDYPGQISISDSPTSIINGDWPAPCPGEQSLIVDGNPVVSLAFWRINATIEPNTDYCIQYRVRNLNPNDPDPKIEVSIAGTPIDVQADGVIPTPPTEVTPAYDFGDPCDWIDVCGTWNSGPMAGTFPLEMKSLATTANGNDFAIDDIRFGKTCNKRGFEEPGLPDAAGDLLLGNFPNPFAQSTEIRYTLPENGRVELVVSDLLGQQVQVLVNANQTEGPHQVQFEANGLPTGTYLYLLRVTTENGILEARKKMIINR